MLAKLDARPTNGDVPLADRLDRGTRVGRFVELPLPLRARLRPDVLERREVEVALRGEVAVEDRLGDSGGAGDLGGSGAVIAPVGEETERRLDQMLTALGSRHPGRTDGHAAISTMCSRTTSGRVRTRAIATTA